MSLTISKLLSVAKTLSLMGGIDKINRRTTFHTVLHLENQLVAGVRKIWYLRYGKKEMGGYIWLKNHLLSYHIIYGENQQILEN